MDADALNDQAGHVIAALRAHEPELRQAGVRRLDLFGSVARGAAGPGSDVDLWAEFDPSAGIGLLELIGLERRVGEIVGRPAEILSGPIENPYVRACVDQERIRVF